MRDGISTKATRKPSYRVGVEWIAHNDEPGCMDVEEVGGMISVMLLADLFGKYTRHVAEDVIRARKRANKAAGRS